MDFETFQRICEPLSGYSHFDVKCRREEQDEYLQKHWNYLQNPKNIASHSFLPFIEYEKKLTKYSNENKEKKVKSRPICYASHQDRNIFKYYSYLINEEYTKYVIEEGFSDSAVAYRTDLGKSNIDFAVEAISFISEKDCDILIGDFTGFFDNLDHGYLKKMLRKVLNVQTLPDDYYAVIKHITQFSTWNLIDILYLRGLIKEREVEILKKKTLSRENQGFLKRRVRKLNQLEFALTPRQFKEYKKKYVVKNTKNYGIPQGSPISAVLSNVYMIDFDEKMRKYVDECGGLYLRYSDDFIVVVPKGSQVEDVGSFVDRLVEETESLTLEPKKTQKFEENGSVIFNKFSNEKDEIDYLGFSYDGHEVHLRAKTKSKYYYRMYRQLNRAVTNGGRTRKGNLVSFQNLYGQYTERGAEGYQKVSSKNGIRVEQHRTANFFTYANRADSTFRKAGLNTCIKQDSKRHLQKIGRVRNKMKKLRSQSSNAPELTSMVIPKLP